MNNLRLPIDGIVARYVILDVLLLIAVVIWSEDAYRELYMNHFTMGVW